jgi:hypothetical protein
MSKSLWYLAAAVTLAAALISCGGKGNQSETATPAANTAGKPVDSATAGTVTGTIKLDGTAPKPRNINMAAEPNCAKARSTPATTEDVVPGDGGTLQNVVVYLKGDFSQYSFPPPPTTSTPSPKTIANGTNPSRRELSPSCKASRVPRFPSL